MYYIRNSGSLVFAYAWSCPKTDREQKMENVDILLKVFGYSKNVKDDRKAERWNKNVSMFAINAETHTMSVTSFRQPAGILPRFSMCKIRSSSR